MGDVWLYWQGVSLSHWARKHLASVSKSRTTRPADLMFRHIVIGVAGRFTDTSPLEMIRDSPRISGGP